MANSTIQELQDALRRSGLPTDNYEQMKKASPFAKYAIRDSVYGSSSGDTAKMTDEYKQKIAKIAEVDKRLSGLYSDPSSQLYIERPTTRENILTGAEDVGFKQANSILEKIKQRQQESESQSSDLLTFFKDLTASLKPESGGSDDLMAILKILQGEEPMVEEAPVPTEDTDYGFKNVEPRALDSMTFSEDNLDDLDRIYLDSLFEDSAQPR